MFGAKKQDGFFIEAGAHDGVEASNTLYLEKKMGWKGLLVEPNPDTFAGIIYNLKCFGILYFIFDIMVIILFHFLDTMV